MPPEREGVGVGTKATRKNVNWTSRGWTSKRERKREEGRSHGKRVASKLHLKELENRYGCVATGWGREREREISEASNLISRRFVSPFFLSRISTKVEKNFDWIEPSIFIWNFKKIKKSVEYLGKSLIFLLKDTIIVMDI